MFSYSFPPLRHERIRKQEKQLKISTQKTGMGGILVLSNQRPIMACSDFLGRKHPDGGLLLVFAFQQNTLKGLQLAHFLLLILRDIRMNQIINHSADHIFIATGSVES